MNNVIINEKLRQIYQLGYKTVPQMDTDKFLKLHDTVSIMNGDRCLYAYKMTPPKAESADCLWESTTYPIAAEHPIVTPIVIDVSLVKRNKRIRCVYFHQS